MRCKNLPKKYNDINGILFHVLFLFIILSLLFVFYISEESGKAINGLINSSINNIDFSKFDNSNIIKNIFKEISNKEYDSLINYFKKHQDPLREYINLNVKQEMAMTVFFLIVLIIVYNLLPVSLTNYCTKLLPLFTELFFYFIIVIFVEIWFFKSIASKYVPVEPSYLYSYINKKIILLFGKNG